METLRVGTFNTKDNAVNRNGGLKEDGISNADIVSKIIKENQFDLLGTQELTVKYVSEIASRLENYKFYGSYRYGNLLTKIPFNENNNIITKHNIILEKTLWLPWIANNLSDLHKSIKKMSIMPRIATVVILEDEDNKKICMINTHLDYQISSIQIRQLEALKKIIDKYSKDYSIILTGDFNMEFGNKNFDSFVSDMKNTLQHVNISEKTWHGPNGEEATLDHIFIPKNWEVENVGIIDSRNTSDHDIIYTDVRRR